MEPYRFTKDFYRALLRYVTEEPVRGGRVLRALDPVRIASSTARHALELARSHAEQHQWQAPTQAELRQRLLRTASDGTFTSEETKEVNDLLVHSKHANGISRDVLLTELVREIRAQALKQGLDEAIQHLGDGRTDAAFARLELASLAGRDILAQAQDIRIPADLGATLRKIRERGGVDHALSPVPELDRYMRGGASPGEVAVILGTPASGKSTWLCDLTTANLRGGCARVVHYTLEMSAADVVTKVTANLLGLTIETLETGQKPIRELERNVSNLLAERDSQYVVRHVPPGQLTAADIRQHLRALRVEQNFACTLVVVDYADIMSTGKRVREGSYVEQGEIYDDLKILGLEFTVPVWTGSQAKRESVDQARLYQDAAAESFRKVFKAEYIVSIGALEEDRQSGMVRLYIAKNRFGKTGVEIGPFPTDFARGRFIMLPDDASEELVLGDL